MFLALSPSGSFEKACHVPQILGSPLGILQALLNLNALMLFDERSQSVCVSDWSVEGLMTATFVIVDVFANDLPVCRLENLISKDFIGICKAVENESNST